MIDQCTHGFPVVDADLVERGVQRAVDEHARQANVPQIGERATCGIGARRQDDAVDATLVKGGDDRQLAFRVVLGVRQEDHHPETGAFRLDRADDVAEIGVGDGRHGDPDRAGRRGLERAGQSVRAVADRVDDGLHGLAVGGATLRVPFTTCETVDTETPALRATSAIVATPPPRSGSLEVLRKPRASPFGARLAHRNVCATVSMPLEHDRLRSRVVQLPLPPPFAVEGVGARENLRFWMTPSASTMLRSRAEAPMASGQIERELTTILAADVGRGSIAESQSRLQRAEMGGHSLVRRSDLQGPIRAHRRGPAQGRAAGGNVKSN